MTEEEGRRVLKVNRGEHLFDVIRRTIRKLYSTEIDCYSSTHEQLLDRVGSLANDNDNDDISQVIYVYRR